METLGTRLGKARDKKRLRQSDVAKMLGIQGGTLSGYERDYRDPDTKTLAELARIYDVSVDYLTTGKEAKNELHKEETEIETINRETNEYLKLAKTVDQAKLVRDLAKTVFKNEG